MDDSPKKKSYLGIEFSTQQVKAIIIDDQLKVLQEVTVQFDSELPEYRTRGGVNFHDDDLMVTAPVIMWVKALDMLMDKLRVAGADFSSITAVSGAGQQHGSVYWRQGSSDILGNLQHNSFLFEQLYSCFSLANSPIWMDSSTSKYCMKLEKEIGGPQVLSDITGSRAFERFTGNQISKIYTEKYDVYKNTERISLVSSFGCSIFLGNYAPIDFSDGSGMNLLDIRTKQWNQLCLDACASELKQRLGQPVPSNTIVGKISNYFVERFDFDPECSIVAFTGDNPASLAGSYEHYVMDYFSHTLKIMNSNFDFQGMCLQKGDIAVSLGTSDSLFLWLDEPKPKLDGHVFINPVDPAAYMALLCFKNGSLTREKIRDESADGTWDIFNQLLDMTPRGNFGNIGMYYYKREINPDLEGVFRFTKARHEVDRFTSRDVEVRALVEGQFMAKRIYAHRLGLNLSDIKHVLATGGASANKNLLQVLSDVFNSPVYTMPVSNSACLGSTYRAKHSLSNLKFEDIIKCSKFSLVCSPNKDSAQVYDTLVERFERLENDLQNRLK